LADYPQPIIEASKNDASFSNALQQISTGGIGTLTIGDSLTYTKPASINVSGDVEVQARNLCRPVVRPDAPADWIFTGTNPAATLVFDGLFVSGGATVVLAGTFDAVTLRCCTLDPGNWGGAAWKAAADGLALAASALRIDGVVRHLRI